MSSLQSIYSKMTNHGIPKGPIVSDQEYQIFGVVVMQATVTLNGGGATISIDNGDGFTTPQDMVEGPSIYDLSNCIFKITLTGSATVGVS